jgi:hypothetical protein
MLELVKLEPEVIAHRRDRALVADRIAVAYATLGDYATGTSVIAKAIADYEPTATANAKQADFVMPMSALYRLHTAMVTRSPTPNDAIALESARKSVELVKPLLAAHAGDRLVVLDYAAALGTYADMVFQMFPDRRKEAFELDADSERLMLAAIAREPTDANLKARLEIMRDTVVSKARRRAPR